MQTITTTGAAINFYRAILQAAEKAPCKNAITDSNRTIASFAQCLASLPYYFSSMDAEEDLGAASMWVDEVKISMGEVREVFDVGAPEFLTFKHNTTKIKIKNCEERLKDFAAQILAKWAIWGGGEKPTQEKKRARVKTWPAAKIQLFKHLLEDGDAESAFLLAKEMGGKAFASTQPVRAILYTAPEPFIFDGVEVDGLVSALRDDGLFVVMHWDSGLGLSGKTVPSPTRGVAERRATECIQNGSGIEQIIKTMASIPAREDISATWCAQHGITQDAAHAPEPEALPEVATDHANQAQAAAESAANTAQPQKLPPTDIRVGDSVIVEGEAYTVIGPLKEAGKSVGVVASRDSDTNPLAGVRQVFLRGDAAIVARIAAQQAQVATGQQAAPAAPDQPPSLAPRSVRSSFIDATGDWETLGEDGSKKHPGFASEKSARIAISKNPDWKKRELALVPFDYNDGSVFSPYAETRTRFAIVARKNQPSPSVATPVAPVAPEITPKPTPTLVQQAQAAIEPVAPPVPAEKHGGVGVPARSNFNCQKDEGATMPALQYISRKKFDALEVGVLNNAELTKTRAYKELQHVKALHKAGNANRLDVLKASIAHKEALRYFDAAASAVESAANRQGLTTKRKPNAQVPTPEPVQNATPTVVQKGEEQTAPAPEPVSEVGGVGDAARSNFKAKETSEELAPTAPESQTPCITSPASPEFVALMAQARSARSLAREAIARAKASSRATTPPDDDPTRAFPHLVPITQNERQKGGTGAAPNIRRHLKNQFPCVKFSVTSDYSQVNVRWTDGPATEDVDAALAGFDIGRSDSMTDYFYTETTRFSERFGGVQYLFTKRSLSDGAISAALLAVFGQDAPSVEDYRAGRSWAMVKPSNWSDMPDQWHWLAMVRNHANGIDF